MSLKLKSVVEGAIVPLLALVVWEACARAGRMSAVVLPAPSAVAAKWWASLLPMQPHDPAQMGYLLSGIDWRNPVETWRPTAIG